MTVTLLATWLAGVGTRLALTTSGVTVVVSAGWSSARALKGPVKDRLRARAETDAKARPLAGKRVE